MLEQIIQLVTILFLLSMVCERVADFLKHYLNNSQRLGIGDTITKFPGDDIKEQARAYRILKINVWCGIITAVILKADLIKILNNVQDSGKTIGWSNIQEYKQLDYLFLPFGLILTGCFISFGSKFWHDLLDILLEIKNAKRTLTQTNIQQLSNPGAEFEKLNPAEKDQVLKSAIQVFSNYWEASISNYKRVDAGKKITNNQPTENNCLRFYVDNKEYKGKVTTPVPEYVYYGGFKIPTDVIMDTGEMKLHIWKNAGNGSIPVSPGKSISRRQNMATGTISLKVKKNIGGVDRFFALSCYHVLFDNEFSAGKNEVNNESEATMPTTIKTPGDDVTSAGVNIATVGWGKIDEFVDAGVALLEDPGSLEEEIDFLGKPVGKYAVIADDVNSLSVSFCGAKSGLVPDKLIKGCHAIQSVNTPAGKIVFNDLIQIERCSDFGDSGAPVIDQYKRLVGIIEGGDNEYTYIIPIQNIINRIKITPLLNQ